MSESSKKAKNNACWLPWTLPTVTFAVVIALLLTNYSLKTTTAITSDETEALFDQVYSYGERYEELYAELLRTAALTAEFSAETADPFAIPNYRLLRGVLAHYPVTGAYLVKTDGTARNASGNSCNDLGKRYLNKLPLDGPSISDYFKTPVGRQIALISAPIRTEMGTRGFVVFEFAPKSLKEVVDTPEYVSSSVYALVSKRGVIVDQAGLQSSFMALNNNFFEDAAKYEFVRGSVSEMKQTLAAGRSGYAQAKINAMNERIFLYKPVGENGDFLLVSVNMGTLQKKIADRTKTTDRFATLIYILLGVFVVILFSNGIVNVTTNTKKSKELQDKAETDLLTGLLNKIATEERIKNYLQDVGRDKISMMFILDIDNFKNINDTMGHAFGDEVISALGRQLSAEFRVTDIVGRTGGDEFTIFLKDLKDRAVLRTEAERVLNIFKNFKVGEYTKYFATASIGVAIYPQDANSFEALYKAADQALYKAKNQGKNQMAFYRDLTEQK